MQRFSPMPFMFCNIHSVCTYGSRTSTSYWLATGESVPMMPVGDDSEVRRHISRCSVCQAPAPLLTLHSQQNDVPACPRGWTKLWQGYSFVMVSTNRLFLSFWSDGESIEVIQFSVQLCIFETLSLFKDKLKT